MKNLILIAALFMLQSFTPPPSNSIHRFTIKSIDGGVIDFSKFKNVIQNNTIPKNTLKNIDSGYKLLVFGSSKCHKCMEEIPMLENVYINFKKNNFLEIIFISLDENQDDFMNFSQNFSFPSVCTLEKWETPFVKEYLVQFTPSMFLMDKDLKIILKPNSVEHLKSWLTKYSK